MDLNKICPVCDTEYLPEIVKCADCGADLLLPGEYEKAQDEKKALMKKAVENAVTVREGDLKWLKELYAVLIGSGIPCTIESEAGCRKSCCGDKCRLVVSSGDHEAASARIEEYFSEMHPEILASRELVKEGKCPACGSPVGETDSECSDCGLALVIIEGEDQ